MGSNNVDYQRSIIKYHYPLWMRIWYSTARWLYFKAERFYQYAESERKLWQYSENGTFTTKYKFFR